VNGVDRTRTSRADAAPAGRGKLCESARNQGPEKVVTQVIAPARFVTIKLAAACTGLTVKAIEQKIARGDWAKGKHYRKAADGRIYVDMEGFAKWVAGERV
jgi:hypothetical protein